MRRRINFLKVMLTCFGILFGFIPLAYSQTPIDVRIPNSNGEADSTVTIPIKVSNLTDRDVISYQTTITFDENVLDATGASSNGTLTEVFGPPTVNTQVDGQIALGGFGTSPLNGSGTLVNLVFKVVGASGHSTELQFVQFVFNNGDPPVNTQGGTFSVGTPVSVEPSFSSSDAGFNFIFQNYPNPFNLETAIRFDVTRDKGVMLPVNLSIYNVSGRLVRTLLAAERTSGLTEIKWDGRDQQGQPVSSGIYFYNLIIGDFSSSKMLSLSK